ncbi:uncharacterized protein LOC130990935 [Salvia miltiorrhiza]|uniref:uncharacterized protein LOC130990935 n=1 Tax=Salvia miltiorrhiza TaxID=226208 RepID=UPI0025ACDE0D|nr:uncharacterized protein LOC130990935 [Salvia miltiorrhiza]XP_057771140.1 uncharacterized protein LOC130990935 [Salvia miltiorrhiza]XP_057771142.1 uncharacterized protein LOC130990935 [Salvia miltiorrhiza]
MRSSSSLHRHISRSGENITVLSNGKILCTLTNGILRPSNKIRRHTSRTFQAYIEITGTSWKALTEDTIEVYFNRFINAFEWDPSMYSREFIRTAWIKIARVAYKDFLSVTKKLVLIEKKTPLYLKENVETAWKANWDLPEVKRKSEQASKNRRSKPGGPGIGIAIHHGSSRSAIDHAEHMAREKNIPVDCTAYDTFLRIHRKGGLYTGPRFEAHAVEIESRIQDIQATKGRVPTPEEVHCIFKEVVKRDAKGRVLGIRMMTQMVSSGSSTQSTSTSQTAPAASLEEVEALRAEVNAQVARGNNLEARMQEQDDTINDLKSMLAELMANIKRGHNP